MNYHPFVSSPTGSQIDADTITVLPGHGMILLYIDGRLWRVTACNKMSPVRVLIFQCLHDGIKDTQAIWYIEFLVLQCDGCTVKGDLATTDEEMNLAMDELPTSDPLHWGL